MAARHRDACDLLLPSAVSVAHTAIPTFRIASGTSRHRGDWARMTIPSYYRAEAERCRDLAAIAADADIARRWHRLADEYAVLAEELAAAEAGRTPILRTPTQQQNRVER